MSRIPDSKNGETREQNLCRITRVQVVVWVFVYSVRSVFLCICGLTHCPTMTGHGSTSDHNGTKAVNAMEHSELCFLDENTCSRQTLCPWGSLIICFLHLRTLVNWEIVCRSMDTCMSTTQPRQWGTWSVVTTRMSPTGSWKTTTMGWSPLIPSQQEITNPSVSHFKTQVSVKRLTAIGHLEFHSVWCCVVHQETTIHCGTHVFTTVFRWECRWLLHIGLVLLATGESGKSWR